MPLPRMRCITSIYVTFFILDNQHCWTFIISAVQLNNSTSTQKVVEAIKKLKSNYKRLASIFSHGYPFYKRTQRKATR